MKKALIQIVAIKESGHSSTGANAALTGKLVPLPGNSIVVVSKTLNFKP